MANLVGAILLDTRSIQKYVFGCNRLKTNTGASWLVDSIFSEAMVRVLQQSGLRMPSVGWEKTQSLQMEQDAAVECEIAYIGGGNMLVLVNKGTESLAICRQLVQRWSLQLLLAAPGLKTGVAIGEIALARDAFAASLGKLYRQLKENQNNVMPQVDLPYTGFTIECDYSGKAVNVFNKEYQRLVSAEVQAKTQAFACAAAKNKQDYASSLGDEYEFASELERVGYRDGESYISVIHIDGNNMGVKFSSCRDMSERKALSLAVKRTVQNAFGYLVNSIITEYDSYDQVLDMRVLQQGNKRLLPLRPIIIGGDDITFICPGRMGLQYAKTFINYVNSEDLLDDDLYNHIQRTTGRQVSKSLSCCAGVAIVPAKYPFFRAYELAEQLCDEAKGLSRKDDGSYLDFAILHGEKYADIALLRKEQYTAKGGSLHYGPYNVLGGKKDAHSMNALFALADFMAKKMPQNKVKDLRRVLHEDAHSMAVFLDNCAELQQLMQELTNKKQITADDLWDKNGATRFIDAIEIMDFVYPQARTGVK